MSTTNRSSAPAATPTIVGGSGYAYFDQSGELTRWLQGAREPSDAGAGNIAAQILSHYEDLKYQGWSRQINEPRSSSSLAPPTFRLPNLTDHPLERDLLGSLDALLLVPECDAARTSLIAATGNETEVEILRVIEDAQTGVRSLNGGSHLVERRDEGFSGTTDGGCQAKDEGDDDPPKEQITETLYGGGELEGVWKIA